MAHPEALTVIGKDTQGGLRLVAENKKSSAKWIGPKYSTTHAAQSVNALAKVNGLNANQNPHLWGYLNHRPRSRKQLSNSMHWGGSAAAVWILSSNPAGERTSMRH